MQENIKFYLILLTTLLLCISTAGAGVTDLWIEKVDPTDTSSVVFIGDTLELQLRLNTYSENITGFQFYIEYNSDVFEPLLDNAAPFTQGSFITNPPLGNSVVGNTLFYTQLTPPGSGGNRPFVNGIGIAATFKLKVKGILLTPNALTEISCDDAQSGYYLLGAPGTLQPFYNSHSFTTFTDIFQISPGIADTMLAPGTSLNIDLSHHIAGNINVSQVQWQFTPHNTIAPGITAQIVNQHFFKISSTVGSQGLVQGELRATISGSGEETSQIIKIAVNKIPQFNPSISTIEIYEDVPKRLAKSEIFTDADNQGADFNLWTDHQKLTVQNTPDDSLTITSSENWFGNGDFNFFVQDILQDSLNLSIDTSLSFSVLAVNDPPVLNFSAINDTISVYHDTTVTLDLSLFTSDVDDQSFTWYVNNLNPLAVTSQIQGTALLLSPADSSFFGVVTLVLRAEDPQGAVGSDTLYARISHFPPDVQAFPDVFISAGNSQTLSLNNYVSDPDTPPADLSWAFFVLDVNTLQPVSDITIDYQKPQQTVTFSTSQSGNYKYFLAYTVTDPSANRTTGQVKLVVSSSQQPFIYPIAEVITFPDTTIEPFDLDTLVTDPTYATTELSWEVKGVDHLQNVSISPSEHFVQIHTNSSFLGLDTIRFITTNPAGSRDSIDVAVRCIPRGPKPFIAALPDFSMYWKTSSPLFFINLDQFVFDLDTPDSLIQWQASFNAAEIGLQINQQRNVYLTSNSFLGLSQIIFEATDQFGNSSSDTIRLEILEDNAPVWQAIDPLFVSRKNASTPIALKDYCLDDLTNSESLIYTYSTESSPRINISIDPVTTGLTLSVTDSNYIGQTWLRLSATDGHGHTSWSDTVTVNIKNSQPPVWQQIPSIQFSNSIIYANLFLRDFCQDPENQSITYSAVSNQPQLNIQIIDTSSQVLLSVSNGFFGTARIIFRATDSDGNISNSIADIIIYDATPPQGNVFYHFNPVMSNHVDFVIIADTSTQTMESWFSKNGNLLPLQFSILEKDSSKEIWKAGYHFKTAGNYRLKTRLTDKNGNAQSDSVNWAITFAKRSGGVLKSKDQLLELRYRGDQFKTNQLIALSEKKHNLNDRYEIIAADSKSGPVEILYYTNPTQQGLNFSYYYQNAGVPEQIPTFIDKDGNFRATIDINRTFIFKHSQSPAQEFLVQDYRLDCYPNPFNAALKISYTIRERQKLNLQIYNILGQRVYKSELGENEPGQYAMSWNGINQQHNPLPSGMYFIQISGNKGIMLTKKVMMIK